MNDYIPDKPVSLDEAMRIAEKAKDYARTYIKKGATQLENNALEQINRRSLSHAMFDMRQAQKKSCQDAGSIIEDAHVADYELRIRHIVKYSLGNCNEMALQAFEYILVHSDNRSINAELYQIQGGDHVFLVINRDPYSNPFKPETWGENALICDPWSDKIYLAKDYLSQLKDYRFERQGAQRKNITVDFDPNKQSVIPYKRPFNTAYFRKYRSAHYIEKRFFKQATHLIKVMETYQASLKTEKTKLKEKAQIDILTNKMDDIEKLIPAIHEKMATMAEISRDYRQARIELMQYYKEIYQAVTATMQFSQAELATLFAEPSTDSYIKTGWMRLFGKDTKSRFEEITEETNEALMAPLKKWRKSIS